LIYVTHKTILFIRHDISTLTGQKGSIGYITEDKKFIKEEICLAIL